MKNQREIIRNVRSMSVHELLDLVVYNHFFSLTPITSKSAKRSVLDTQS